MQIKKGEITKEVNREIKAVIYSSPFIPAEWIAAHGLRPCRVAPLATDGATLPAREGVCPYARAFAGRLGGHAGDDAFVITTACDQLRRAAEWAEEGATAPMFLFNLPATWETANAQKMYLAELKRLGRFLIRLGGHAPDDAELATVMRDYDARRAVLRDARGRLSGAAYSRAIAEFHWTGEFAPDAEAPERTARGIPLAVVGGPLLADHFGLLDLIEQAGGELALDATTTGERTLPAPFEPRRIDANPLQELAAAYFGQIPDAFRRPNSLLYRWLKEKLAERGVRGVIFHHYVWCDTWRAEARRMQEWLALPENGALPFLSLDEADASPPDARTASRLQALLELLQ